MSLFQSSASLQGRQFADQCDLLLRNSGYEVGARVLVGAVGIEIDREAVSPSGRIVWFEYKGSVQGSRPGLLRTDTLKKAIAKKKSSIAKVKVTAKAGGSSSYAQRTIVLKR